MFHSRASVPVLALSLVASLSLAPSPAPAGMRGPPLPGTYVVDPAGGADFTDLQTALDTVPPESTVVVKGVWRDYWTFITKSVTVVGLHLEADGNDNPVPDDAIIEVDAGSGARVTFSGLEIALGWNIDFNGTRGINIHSAGDVVIADSKITCGRVLTSLYDYYERDGDGVVVTSADSLFIVRSTIQGGGPGSMHYDCNYWGEHGPRGGHAVQIDTLHGALVVEDSVLKGGDGGTLERGCDDCSLPPPFAGMPGSGIVNRDGVSYLSNSTVVAGAPGHGWRSACDPWPGTPGAPGVDVDGARIDLPDALHSNDAELGQPLHLNGDGYRPAELVLLFFSTSIGPPLALRQGPWLLDWPIVLVAILTTDGAGAFALDGTVPNDAQIEGKSLALQAFAASRVSEPLLLVPWTQH